MMSPYYYNAGVMIYHGDCLDILPQIDETFSTVITDPPYGLKFMGKEWDYGVPGIPFWEVILEVVAPGAMLLSFGGTRTYHRLACAIEDAGWEIRDCLMWLHALGFPKSQDISKAIDKKLGAEREVIGKKIDISTGRPMSRKQASAGASKNLHKGYDCPWRHNEEHAERMTLLTAPASDKAKQWDGYGTNLKPAWEPIILAMAPRDGTFANNALKHGVAGLNINEGRIPTEDELSIHGTGKRGIYGGQSYHKSISRVDGSHVGDGQEKGRWPANLIHDGSAEVLAGFPQTKSGTIKPHKNLGSTFQVSPEITGSHIGDSGSAARFFYCAKASKKERGEYNNHPTVKPYSLMKYLCTLTKMPTDADYVLDPFCGSGSTLLACIATERECVGIDSDEKACEIAAKRIDDFVSSA